MEPTQVQPTNQLINTQPTPMMPPDQAAASLAFATHLSTQMMQHQNPKQAPQEPQPAPEQAPQSQEAPVDQKGLKDEIMKDVKEAIKGEMSSLRDELKQALTDEQDK